MDILPSPVKNFIDSIFKPPIAFLDKIIELLGQVSMVAGKGINLNNYFVFFSYLPDPFIDVVNSLLASAIFLMLLRLIKVVMRSYGAVKAWIKWW